MNPWRWIRRRLDLLFLATDMRRIGRHDLAEELEAAHKDIVGAEHLEAKAEMQGFAASVLRLISLLAILAIMIIVGRAK